MQWARVLSRSLLPAGAISPSFSPLDVLEALPAADKELYVSLEADGALPAAAALARPAPHVPAAAAALGPAPGGLRLRLLRPLPPGELLIWFDADLLAKLDMPFLTPRNIRDRSDYVCTECGATFEQPNPCKLHMFLRCRDVTPTRLWRALAQRLAPAPGGPPAAERASAFRPYDAAPGLPAPDARGEEALAARSAAAVEALAAEWGRARGGHVCVYCGKLYSRKYGLKIHIRTHTGYKPLRCAHCRRAFGDPSNLNKHVRLHARDAAGDGAGGADGAGRLACGLCGARLARRRDLERHLRSRHARDVTRKPDAED